MHFSSLPKFDFVIRCPCITGISAACKYKLSSCVVMSIIWHCNDWWSVTLRKRPKDFFQGSSK